ncbi:TetR/AcrR family transcriptional regulator [Stieleria sp. TO1_6]|uniref:TetR/AcrR family transcriptional regulator n=1 Tax=Stieleria tagensis TaxID=2956795 RepID=UPI00209AC793|nr:TetR/AcrR family transcriptional regulator [Stieleria tagensis]MCO8125403.1 TetR/AcrR family transcriptional regulator [Stieleria tagensis]
MPVKSTRKSHAGKNADAAVGRRPKTADRIISAATELFLRDGYSSTNLEQVAEMAGVTKPTVYSHFKSKEGLLSAVSAAQAKSNADRIMTSLEPTGDTKADLLNFGQLFLETVLGENAVSWHRLSIAESRNHPEVGHAVYASGPARVIAAVTEFIAAETQAGRLQCANAQVAAEQFIGLLSGVNPIRVLTGQRSPTKATLRRNCAEAVKTFLAAFATEQT